MEATYQRYAEMVRAADGTPVDFQTFAVSGLLQSFLEFERLIGILGFPANARNFLVFREAVRSGKESTLLARFRQRLQRGQATRKPRAKKNPLPDIESAQQFIRSAMVPERQSIFVDVQPISNTPRVFTEEQLREIAMFRHYRDNLPLQSFQQAVLVHGYNPLERYKVD